MRVKLKVLVPTMIVGLAALLAACGSDSTNPPAATSATGSPAPTVNKDPASFLILNNDGGEAYAKQAKKDDIFYKEMSKLFSDYIGAPTELAYEFIPAADFSQQLTVRFASRDFPQIIATSSITDKGHPTAVENGIFQDLTPLIEKYGPNLKKKIPKEIWDNPRISRDGKIYAIPKLLTPLNPRALLIRKDWLDKLGMKQPETVDEYLAFFEAVKTKDPNGNGKNDEYGYVMRADMGFSNAFFAAYDVELTGNNSAWQFENNQFIPDIINPRMKEAIKLYKLMYDKGYIKKDWVTLKAADWVKDITDDTVAVWSHDLRNVPVSWSPDKFVSKNAVVDLLPGIKNQKGQLSLGFRSLSIAKVHVITKDTKNPERFVQFMDWTYSDDAKKTNFFTYGIAGRNFTETAGKIDWNATSDFNTKEKAFFQTMINPAGDTRTDPKIIERMGGFDPKVLEKGVKYSETNLLTSPSINMELPEVLTTKPELGSGTGTLFQDMFAKVVTGKEEADAAFDKFVADWKKRGGDEAIKQATDWYNKNIKK
jgi:ABC-type glycerol-3-phosphate transport system substrate-binding protein